MAIAAALFGCSAPARAETAPPFLALLRTTIDRNPAATEQAANIRAAQSEARQSRAYPNPSIGAEFENLAVPRNGGGSTDRQTTVSVTQPFEIGGKRSARMAYGERLLAAAEARARLSRVGYAGQLAIAYATAEAALQRRALATEDLSRAQEDLRAARALVLAGREANLREMQARASLAAASAAVQGTNATVLEALDTLSALSGRDEAFTNVTPSLLTTGIPARAMVGPSLEQSPAVAEAAAEHAVFAAQLRVERARPIPDIGLSLGARRFQGSSDTALVVGLSATIPLFDRNKGNIAAAEARAEAANARLSMARLQATAARRSASSRIAAAEAQIEAAVAGEMAAGEAYRLARIGYGAGKTSLIELLATRRAFNDARALTIDARLERVRGLIALAGLDGRIPFGDQ